MTQTIEHTPPRFWLLAAAVLLVAVAASWLVAPRIVIGLLAGGVWNLVSLWCLSRLLNAWVTPRASRLRALGWLLVKFPLLYVLVFLLLRAPSVSLVGFSLGFTAVLAVAMGWCILRSQRMMVPSHGR